MRNLRAKLGKLRNAKCETAVYVNEQQTELRYERSNHRLSRVVLVFRSPQLALQTTVYTMFVRISQDFADFGGNNC